MKRKTLFIINPISGGKKKDSVPQLVKAYYNGDATTVFTTGVAHANQVASAAIGEYDMVVAVGGDGTVNEVASALVGSKTILGVVPCGSGNGLSRFLQIPMEIGAAIKNLNTGDVALIDSARANGKPFFNMAGMGFDAHISEVFSHGKKRGFISYIRSSLQEVLSYQPQSYNIEVDGQTFEREAFMLSFANSSQYGNNAHISPQASVQDGLLDVCIIKPFPLYRFVGLVIRMFNKTVNKSRFVEIISGKHIIIERKAEGPMHLDGEPEIAAARVEINILPASLNIMVGKGFNKVA